MSILPAILANQAAAETVQYVDDVFSAYVYTGIVAALDIVNGLDLATDGGMVWIKNRDYSGYHVLTDTVRGVFKRIYSNDAAAEIDGSPSIGLSQFNSDGYTYLGNAAGENRNGDSIVSWSFKKAPKFFDMVEYVGDGEAGRQIPHSLGCVPGMIVVKMTSGISDWYVLHRSLGGTKLLALNEAWAASAIPNYWNNTDPTDSVFTVGSGNANASGSTYIAYLFAHDPDPDGLIQCGSFTTDATEKATINLGWEPQYVLFKRTDGVMDWNVYDTIRGLGIDLTAAYVLEPNTSDAETDAARIKINSQGFEVGGFGASRTCIYLAIRRPNKPATSGTGVFNEISRTGTGADAEIVNLDFTPDCVWTKGRDDATNNGMSWDRLRGNYQYLFLETSGTEGTTGGGISFSSLMNGVLLKQLNNLNRPTYNYINYMFKRAPGFFDIVGYKGTGVAGRTVNHGLGVVPELIIVKDRSLAYAWAVYHKTIEATKYLTLSNNDAAISSTSRWNDTMPTDSLFTIGDSFVTNKAADSYIAYFFATLPGISKVSSFNGNGTSQTIDCGFTSGARFVLIKRTDATGDWYFWDSIRGIIAGNDPYLLLNTTGAEVTTTDYIDPDSSGFIVNGTTINTSSGEFIFLAIA